MKITIDSANEALYLRFHDSPIMDSEEIQPGVILDYDEDNRIVGIELLNMSQQIISNIMKNLLIETK